jgi:hypothetical protein
VSDNTPSKKFVSCFLDEDTHRNLVRLATLLGAHPSDLVEQYITRGLLQDAKDLEEFVSPDLKVYAGMQEMRRRARVRAQLVNIAFEHNQNPTEESADLLNRLCVLVGIPVEDIIRDSEETLLVPVVNDDGHGVQSAMAWLARLVEPDQEYSVSAVTDMGAVRGFTPYVIKAAKSNLGLVSSRRSDGWIWKRPEPKT